MMGGRKRCGHEKRESCGHQGVAKMGGRCGHDRTEEVWP